MIEQRPASLGWAHKYHLADVAVRSPRTDDIVRLLTIETADLATTVIELVATEHTMSTVDPRLSTLDLRLVHTISCAC
jgi:hypothetical protein